jgi:5-methylcytosine-specific restriction endonuclease McrA
MSWTHQPHRLAKVTKAQPPKAVAKQIRDAGRETTYKTNSAAARERDGHHCRVCGSLFTLETHHLVPRSIAGRDVRDLVSNLVTLCADCHKDVTRHVVKLYPIDPALGAAACNLRVEKFDKEEGDYILAIEAA